MVDSQPIDEQVYTKCWQYILASIQFTRKKWGVEKLEDIFLSSCVLSNFPGLDNNIRVTTNRKH